MLRAVAFLVKAAFFALAVLVLGNWLSWNGRTLSDQVRVGMAHAERRLGPWAKNEKARSEERIRPYEKKMLRKLLTEN